MFCYIPAICTDCKSGINFYSWMRTPPTVLSAGRLAGVTGLPGLFTVTGDETPAGVVYVYVARKSMYFSLIVAGIVN